MRRKKILNRNNEANTKKKRLVPKIGVLCIYTSSLSVERILITVYN